MRVLHPEIRFCYIGVFPSSNLNKYRLTILDYYLISTGIQKSSSHQQGGFIIKGVKKSSWYYGMTIQISIKNALRDHFHLFLWFKFYFTYTE
jgi:hypothetical protein